MKHLSGVSMPGSTGTQTRSFVYDNLGRLTSATNPENGLVQYFYNSGPSGFLVGGSDNV